MREVSELIKLITHINRLGYDVGFGEDFEGMVRLDYTKDLDEKFYEHEHIGIPGLGLAELERKVRNALKRFLDKHGTGIK